MHKQNCVLQIIWIGLLLLPAFGFAHQPVMDMAPRWAGGLGIQIRHEHHASNQLKFRESKIDNPLGREKRVDKTWLEGVYTFTRAFRVTLKIPYIDQSRIIVKDNMSQKESSKGFGQAIIGIPLKYYWNKEDSTGNIAFTPSIALPTGSTSGNFPISNGGTNLGGSLSLSLEKSKLYQYYDLFYWKNNSKKNGIQKGDELGFDMNLGLHPYHNNLTNSGIFVMLDLKAKYQERGIDLAGTTGGTRLSLGPVFVYYYENIMFRAEYNYPTYEKVFDTQVSYGPAFNIGIGVAF